MQRFIIGIFIVIFAALSIFGVVFMVHQGDARHDGCLAGGAFNTTCPQNISAFSMIDLHFGALGIFSSATFSNLLIAGMAAFLGIALVFASLFGSCSLSHKTAIILRRRKEFTLDYSLFHRQMTEWFAFHNKKDLSFDARF